MTPFEANLDLIAECDKAAEQGFLKCKWCEEHGHHWRECPEYEAFVRRVSRDGRVVMKIRANFWLVFNLLGVGFAAGMCFKALLEGI
jgi:hypothetical protein